MNYLTVDFGSTYTKLTAISAGESQVLGTACAFTTIGTDIMEGFETALHNLEQKIGRFDYDRLLCCSSAGGGLKMVALGLVPGLTAKAARMAASSAGAKVVKTYSFEISQAEQDEIYDINPDLVLLCGGTDGGNKEVIIANARRLCDIQRNFSVIVAGNKSASHELEKIFEASDKDYVVTDNVMPIFNKLTIEPAKECIRELFIRKIIDAKGLTSIQRIASSEIIPTPLAVMTACELLSKGTGKSSGIGELIAIDLGGATTDVYSMAKGKPMKECVLVRGLPEPFSKRTVEGDLGMRYSLNSLLEEIDIITIAEDTGIDDQEVRKWIDQCLLNPDIIAKAGGEVCVEEALAKVAVKVAVERHCGFMESSYSPMGEIFMLTGKDLTEVPYIIGIGGAIINSANPANILAGAEFDPQKYHYMKPKHPQYLLDEKYIFAAMGLLSTADPELALYLLKKEVKPL